MLTVNIESYHFFTVFLAAVCNLLSSLNSLCLPDMGNLIINSRGLVQMNTYGDALSPRGWVSRYSSWARHSVMSTLPSRHEVG